MRPVSDAFVAAMRNGGRVVALADLYRDGVLLEPNLPVTDGQVVVDRSAPIRRTCQVSIAAPTGRLVPGAAGDPLTPYGNEVKLWRGYRLPAGDELLPLGVFRLTVTDVADDGSGGIVITGSGRDRADRVAAALLTDVYIIAAGQNVGDAIKALILDGVPDTVFRFTSVTGTTPQLILDTGANRLAEATKLAESVGCQLYYNADGELVLEEEPSLGSAAPDFEYVEGPASTLLRIGKTWSSDPGYNGAIVLGESTSAAAPVRGEAWDTDPASPTYYLGTYGKRPMPPERSEFAVTADAATAHATLLMRRNLGGTESVAFTAIPNPAHEAGDAVRVSRAAARIAETGILEQFTIPLSYSGAMSGVVRRRRVAP